MDDMDSDDSSEQIPIRDLKMEPGVEELLSSPALEPYMNLALAVMGGDSGGS
jgi:hypothetical protein